MSSTINIGFSLRDFVAEQRASNAKRVKKLLDENIAKIIATPEVSEALKKVIAKQSSDSLAFDGIRLETDSNMHLVVEELHLLGAPHWAIPNAVTFCFLDPEGNQWTMMISGDLSLTFAIELASEPVAPMVVSLTAIPSM